MGPDSLRQLSPSVDREALRAQRKAGSKRADGGVRHNRRLSPVQTRFYISYTPALSRSFRVSRPISPSQPGRTGIKLLPIYTLLHPRAFAEFFEWPIPYRPNSRDELGSICWWLSTSANCGPAVPPRTWAPFRCGSWVPLTTERRHELSVRPDQNEQTTASVRTFDPAGDLLLTDIWPNVFNSSSPTRCLSPPAKHSRFDSRFPRGSSSSEGRARSPRTRFLEHPAHQYLVPVVLHRRPTDKHFRGWHD